MSQHKIVEEFWIDEDHKIKAIKRAGSPNWYLQYNQPGMGQRRESLKTQSKKEARTRGNAFARKFSEGDNTIANRGRHTLQEVSTMRCAWLASKKRSPKTIKAAEHFVRQLMIFLPRGGATPIRELTTTTLEAFEEKLRTTGIPVPSPDGRGKRKARPMGDKALRDVMKLIRSLIRFAVKRGMIHMDPSSAYTLPLASDKDIEVFSAEELNGLYEDPEPCMSDIWRLLTQTCLRVGEFMWLLKEDVMLDKDGAPAALHIRKKVCPQTGQPWKPKHGIERVVSLTPDAAAIVASALSNSLGPWLFTAPGVQRCPSGKWTDNRLRRRLHRRLNAIGISQTGLHRFRHTGATYLANDANMPIVQLRDFLGHKDLKTTMRYLHPRAEHIQQTISRVDFSRLAQNNPIAKLSPQPPESTETPEVGEAS